MKVMLAVLSVVMLAGCGGDDPPALEIDRGDVPAPTSDTLGACPTGGPDATTAPAGCLGPDGQVRRP